MSQFPLTTGSKNNEVKSAQLWLNLALEIHGDRNRLVTDGNFGPATAKVVKDLFNRTQITESDYRLMISSVGNMAARLREIKSSGKNPDLLLKKIIQSEQAIFANLLSIYDTYQKATDNQRAAHSAHFRLATDIAARLKSRTNNLKSQASDMKFQTGFPSILGPLAAKFTKGSIGFIQFLPLVIPFIAGIVITKSATGIYDFLTPHYRDSTTDFKVTKELRAVLDKLSPQDQAIVLATAETQVDDAYDVGHRDGTAGGGLFGNVSKVIKYTIVGGTIAMATYFAWPLLSGARTAATKKFG